MTKIGKMIKKRSQPYTRAGFFNFEKKVRAEYYILLLFFLIFFTVNK